jgi:xylulose-5-phosphate/fructose-6-phosphate phosphoketolase
MRRSATAQRAQAFGTATPSTWSYSIILNLDRYQLALDAIKPIPTLSDKAEPATERYRESMECHKLHVREHGDHLPEVRDWQWPQWRSLDRSAR